MGESDLMYSLKGGMTVVLNTNNDLVPVCLVMGLMICMYYYQLNS